MWRCLIGCMDRCCPISVFPSSCSACVLNVPHKSSNKGTILHLFILRLLNQLDLSSCEALKRVHPNSANLHLDGFVDFVSSFFFPFMSFLQNISDQIRSDWKAPVKHRASAAPLFEWNFFSSGLSCHNALLINDMVKPSWFVLTKGI